MRLPFAFALAALALGTVLPVAQAAASPSAAVVADWSFGSDIFDKRSKPRVPGGSGCDDPGDVLEHPECRR